MIDKGQAWSTAKIAGCNDQVEKFPGRDDSDVLEALGKVLGIAGDDEVGTRRYSAFQETVVQFVLGFGQAARGPDQRLVLRMTARELAMRDGLSWRRGRRSTASYSARTAGEMNIRISLLAAKSKIAADGPWSPRLADTTTLVSITTFIGRCDCRSFWPAAA
jgi:hypothetical protein